jgi:hypothetical protein
LYFKEVYRLSKGEAAEELERLNNDLGLIFADEEYRNKLHDAIKKAIEALRKK